MESVVQKSLFNQHQQTANKLLNIADDLMQIFQDQCLYFKDVTAQNMLLIDSENHVISIANGLWRIYFDHDTSIIQIRSQLPNLSSQKIIDFLFYEIVFFTGNLKLQHPTTVKSKVQILRQTFVEQIFEWVDGESRVEQYLYNICEADAVKIDQLMIAENYYDQAYLTDFAKFGKEIPLEVELNLKHLSLVNSIQGESFIQVQALIKIYDQFCFSASEFLPAPLLRIVQTQYLDSFRFIDLVERDQDFQMLMPHAIEQPNLIGFAKLMFRGYWQNQDLFSKQNFINRDCPYWDATQFNMLPLFHYPRTVNWLFKQNSMVVDWVSRNMLKPSVPLAITALSFVDTSKIHPQVIVLTLNYFKDISARLFVNECYDFAQTHFWFNHHRNQKYSLDDDVSQLTHTQQIAHSVLYLEEWIDLLQLISEGNFYTAKQVFKKQSRVMQAYMHFLQKIVDDLEPDLINYIHPKTHENHDFFNQLKKHQLSASDFRQVLHHPAVHLSRRISVFDSYVADYLVDLFSHHHSVEKSVTWSGLFQQASRWHLELNHSTTLQKLRLSIQADEWQRISPEKYMYYGDWRFEELHHLERVIDESFDFNHCLAVAYSQRMLDGEYIAFHMTSEQDDHLHLTLGCIFQYDQLRLEQLKYPNNQNADVHSMNIARLFIAEFNQMLRQKSYESQG